MQIITDHYNDYRLKTELQNQAFSANGYAERRVFSTLTILP